MLSAAEALYISSHAWVPEQLADYVTAVSGKEPFLVGDFVCYRGEGVLVVVGYPLSQTCGTQDLIQVLEQTRKEFRPERLRLIAPEIPLWGGLKPTGVCDNYFRLELENFKPSPKVRDMVRRAGQELEVRESSGLGREHETLLGEFLVGKQLSPESQELLRALPGYVKRVAETIMLSALDKAQRLVSFCVGQMGAGDWAFYMFHVNSLSRRVPGSSDILLEAFIKKALEHNKRFLNLGLGINPGVSFFKKKWGALPFAPYREAGLMRRNWRSILELIFFGKRTPSNVES
jgi:hypothetical protein